MKTSLRLAITSMGIFCPAGDSAPSACAALRAGISTMSAENKVVDRYGEPLVASRLEGLAASPGSRDRMLEMAARSLREALRGLPDTSGRRVHVSLLLDDSQRVFGPTIGGSELGVIAGALGLPPSMPLTLYAEGNAAGIKAIAEAGARLSQGVSSIEMVVGADSLLDPDRLEGYEELDRLKDSSQPRGLIPGEASACIALCTEEAARRAGLPIFALIEGAGMATEDAPIESDAPLLGEGLTLALRRALEASGWTSDDVRCVYSDLNGEPYRSHEWMLTKTRELSAPQIVHPADCIGDVGAAFSPLLIAMAAVALHRGYARTDKILVSCSSDAGLRGVACIAKA